MRQKNSSGTAIIFLCLFMVFGVISESPAQAIKCAVCGELIIGDHIQVDGKQYHPWCFTCTKCGDPISGGYHEHEGKFYHPECYVEEFAPRCAFCGEPVTGQYVSIDGINYHEYCYLNHVATRCVACGQPITGSYLENYWGQRVHHEHKDNVWTCDTCGRFIRPGDGYLYYDKRCQCEECHKHKVDDVKQVRELVHHAAMLLSKEGIRIRQPLDGINIVLVDRNRLAELSGGDGDSHGLHHVRTEIQNNHVVHEKTTIYLLTHLPHDLLLGVAAHELFHVWQHEQGADGGPAAWREGSANVAMMLIFKTLNSGIAGYHLKSLSESEDPVYGDGYRMASAYLETHGMRKFLEEVAEEGMKRRN